MADFDALARPIRYRLSASEAVDLNTVTMEPGGLRRGVLLEEFDFSSAQAVGYTEKRAQDDGLDVSDVFLGARYIRLGGTIYGIGPGDLQDRVQVVRTALTPTIAYAADQSRYGYLPLEFELPTADSVDFGAGSAIPSYRPLEFRCRPRGQPAFMLRRDSGQGRGADPTRGGAVSFQAQLECADPRMYVRPPIWVYRTTAGTFTLRNRGDYPAPLDILLELPANWAGSPSGAYVQFAIGATMLRLHVPQVNKVQVIRYSGSLKVTTLEVDSHEALRMDLQEFVGDTVHPTVPPGVSNLTISTAWSTGPFGDNTRVMYSESFA